MHTSISMPPRPAWIFPWRDFSWRVVLILATCIGTGLPPSVNAKMVADQFGRAVDVPAQPQRIVALAPSITEILFALDLERRLVGATQFSNYPPPAASLPKVGSYVRLDIEKIVSLKPDLCIAVKDGNPITVIRKLESVGIAVYAVDPRNLEAVMGTMMELGQLLGVGERADAVVAAMADRIERVHTQLAGVERRPGVFFQIGISPIVSAGTPTFIHELIVMAGGTNLAQGPTPYPRFSKEQVIGLLPEVMIITSMARDVVFEQVKADWQQWGDIPAVRNHRIHLIDSDIVDRASPRLVQGLETLAGMVHPDRFPVADTGVKP
jgi:iron complex transport system substrate-binding protein